MWALGVTLYCLVYNKLPFDANITEIQLMEDIVSKEIVLDKREISEGLKMTILGLLEKDPSKRIKLDALMNNSWINQGYEGLLGEEGYELVADLKETEL